MAHAFASSRRILRVVFASLALVATSVFGGRAQAGEPSSDEILQMHDAAQSPARMNEALTIARRILANDPPKSYNAVLRQTILQSLIRGQGPAKEIVGATDTIDVIFDDRSRMIVLAQVATILLDRQEETEHAVRFARRAYLASPPGADNAPYRAAAEATFGRALLAQGHADSAVMHLENAGDAADSAKVLYQLGRAYEKLGKSDRAIGAYVRSIGVFPAEDSTALEPLRALYKKQTKSLKGLDERIAAARRASKTRVALDAKRHIVVVPDWQGKGKEGKPFKWADYAGKVVVIDFWGSWCGPCRMELPLLQKAYDRFKDRVEFVTVNWERHAAPEQHEARALEYMRANALTMPVVFDFDYGVARAFGVEAFPTMFMVGRDGKVQYKNVGVDSSIEKVMVAQIEALLEVGAK